MARDTQPLLILGGIALLAAAGLAIKATQTPKQLTERTAGTGFALTPEQRSVTFRHADLRIDVRPDKRAIDGLATLDFQVLRPIQRLQLDLDPGLPIRSIAVDGRPLERGAWDNPDGQATVTLPRAYQAGQPLRLAIAYGGRPHVADNAPWDGGLVWSRTKDGQPWVASAVQGEGCDLLWPCIDNSLVEVATVELRLTVPKGLSAPANGKLVGVSRLADGRSTWHWRARSPNNYAIALNVGPYREIRGQHRSRFGNVIPLHYWHLPGEEAKARALFAEFAPTLDFFERTIGPYPFGDEKLGVVETPHLGMEHQTINAYGNGYKPAPEGYDWLFNHEFAHEWFGNQLTNRDWDDMWLHEGFGSYMQPLYLQDRIGALAYHAWLWKQRPQLLNKFPLVSGKSQLEETVYDPKTGPGLDIYYKGAWVLHSLRALVGDEAFFRATRRLVYGRPDPRPGNFRPRFGTTDEFVRLASEEAGRDLTWFFDVYVRQARLPRLVTSRRGGQLALQWRTPKGLPFPMPVEVRVDGRLVRVPMTAGRGSLALPAADSAVTIDPDGKLLRQDDAVDAYRDWTAKQKPKS